MQERSPKHIAIIMDGNGRWAKNRGLPRIAGHQAGIKAVEETLEGARDLGIGVITLYTFSTENWKRPKNEVDALFRLLEEYLEKKGAELMKNKIRLSVIGSRAELPRSTNEQLSRVIEMTKDNTGLVLNLALNYGARQEIVRAARSIARDVEAKTLASDAIDEALFQDRLDTHALPDPEILIRTSGEMRISNFLLWQLSYAEFFFLEKMWPDFTRTDLAGVIDEFHRRERRFGG